MFNLPPHFKTPVLLLLVVILLSGAAFCQYGLSLERGKLTGDTAIVPQKSARLALGFLGGFRSAIAALLWIKSDRIHHEFYGNLFDDKELVPLYRLITWLDPHFVWAYYVGSYVVYLHNRPQEALRFAEEGVRANPESATLNYNVGQLYMLTRNDYVKARYHLERALRLSKDEVEKYNALVNLLIVYEKQGDLENFDRIEKLIKKYPVQPEFMEKAREGLEQERD